MNKLTAALIVLLAVPALAVDKAKLADHIRENYSLPAELELELGDPKPSKVPGFDLIELKFKAGINTQTEDLHISKDGRHYLLGGFKDLEVNPDNERLEKVALEGSAVRGKSDASVTVVEYTDFQCPFCVRGYRMMADRIMKDYKDTVRWVYKSLPLVRLHPWAEPAAVAVECAGKQSNGKLWRLHDIFFERQEQITTANFEDKLDGFVKEIGLDKTKFDTCYDKQETLGKVTRDAKEANSMGISGTPAFIVNGHLISGADYEKLKQTIDEALAGKHGKL